MKEFNAMFTGVGGTGVLTAARILATAALLEGQNVRMGEIHGMAQRGGAVSCTVRVGQSVHGPIIPIGKADVILSVEPIEALRSVEKLSDNGTIIIGEYRIIPTAVLLGRSEYPNEDKIISDLKKFAKVVTVNAAKLAKAVGSVLTMNTILLGVAFDLDLIPLKESSIIAAIKQVLPSRYHQMNIDAFEKGKLAEKMSP